MDKLIRSIGIISMLQFFFLVTIDALGIPIFQYLFSVLSALGLFTATLFLQYKYIEFEMRRKEGW